VESTASTACAVIGYLPIEALELEATLHVEEPCCPEFKFKTEGEKLEDQPLGLPCTEPLKIY